MADLKDNPKNQNIDLAPLTEGDCSVEHDAWMNAQIKQTLAKKQAGEMTYRFLDEVMRKFGFNAR